MKLLKIFLYFKKYLIFFKFLYILFLSILLYKKNFKFIFDFSIRHSYFIQEKSNYFSRYFLLRPRPNESNNSLNIREKNAILNKISKNLGKNITSIDKIFLFTHLRLGNAIALLNKFIFYCEIIGCKSIILDKNNFWLIKNKITLKSNNITIEVDDIIKYKKNNNTLIYEASMFFMYFFNIKPEIRFHLLRDEIFKNMPRINSSLEDLYIHIRSGDIFISNPVSCYSQPPLCFYYHLINNFKFRKIYIISSDKENPIIQKLINRYPNIIYNQNTIKQDISLLINAYNIVLSMSSFIVSLIQINYNLINLFDYNFYKLDQKYKHFHYDLYKFPYRNFTIYRMEPSPNYYKIMFYWKNSRLQRKLMIKEKCPNFFRIIRYQ